MESKFKINFIELLFLVEACIPPMPIARTLIWYNIIDSYYYQLSKNERSYLYEYINKNWIFKESLNKEESCVLFNARYNPDNQYLIKTEFDGKIEIHECFLYNGQYHKQKNVKIQEKYIKEIKKIHN